MSPSYGSSLVCGDALTTRRQRWPAGKQEKTSLQHHVEDSDRHLDIGCGYSPRNPYARGHLCGVDIRPPRTTDGFDYRVANLILEPIPFPDNSFSSVSAFDFIEHVPRVFPGNGGTIFPFVRLMDEIWRVLAPGGRLYALTPAYPHPEAFVDPTHVNIITDQSHTYFCGENPGGRMYGFNGRFEVIRVKRTERASAYSALADSKENHPPLKQFSRTLRRWSRWFRGKRASAAPAYLLWELEAVK